LFAKKIDFEILQIPFNILDRAFEPYLKELKHLNIEVHTRSVFLQGLFFKPPAELPLKLKPLQPCLFAIAEFCMSQGITIEELALNGVIHHPDIDGVLVGIDNIIQLRKNINSVWAEIPARISEFIHTLHVKEKELLNPVNWN
jgi:aryl-alcohol dehydrogenase-like predicted oxidoreductase